MVHIGSERNMEYSGHGKRIEDFVKKDKGGFMEVPKQLEIPFK